jgi:hypothetical protein
VAVQPVKRGRAGALFPKFKAISNQNFCRCVYSCVWPDILKWTKDNPGISNENEIRTIAGFWAATPRVHIPGQPAGFFIPLRERS